MADYQPRLPAIDRSQPVFTFQDIVDRLLDMFNTDWSRPRDVRLAKRAVQTAYRNLVQKRKWTCYDARRMTLTTVDPVSDLTLTYDHTGGASERLCTFSGTLPTWAQHARLKIDDVDYRIESVLGTTTATLEQHNNPGADLAAGTACTIWQAVYPLPVEVRTISGIIDTDDGLLLKVLLAHESQRAQVLTYPDLGTDYHCIIRGEPTRLGAKSLEFTSSDTAGRTYDIVYSGMPRPLKIAKYATGTVALGASGTTLTLTSGTFPEDCVGSVIRFAESGQLLEPTSVEGNVDDVDNRFWCYRIITARASASSATIDQLISTSALSSLRYTISSPLDIDADIMLNALVAMAEAEYVGLTRTGQDPSSTWWDYQKRADLALRTAQCADHDASERGIAGPAYVSVRDQMDLSEILT